MRAGGKRPAAEEDLANFIEDDLEESNSLEDSRGDWRSAMRSITGYDPDRSALQTAQEHYTWPA